MRVLVHPQGEVKIHSLNAHSIYNAWAHLYFLSHSQIKKKDDASKILAFEQQWKVKNYIICRGVFSYSQIEII